jgi:hypothetical protein
MRAYTNAFFFAAVPLAGWLWAAPILAADADSVMDKRQEAEQKALESKHEAEEEAAEELELTRKQERRLENKQEAEQEILDKEHEVEKEIKE